ncbi:MAG: DUF2779 domain-containing protein, partial [Candidatus Delongbacteria bacterium]|nr:DUF2779 domain-containing protein [Candidatus Delongbacteria bacterium]
KIPDDLKHFEQILEDRENEPDIDIGQHCSDPYPCDAVNYCWKQQKKIPDYSVFNISCRGSRKAKLWNLYYQGIIRFEDIQDTDILNYTQKIQVECELDNRTIINREEIKKFTKILTYPLYHFDFETFQQAVPEFEGLRPYQQIPSQYSLHIENGRGGLEHKEFLAPAGTDPRRALAESLVNDIPANVMLLAYNRSFEQGVIKNLAELYPDLSEHLMNIHNNIKDLMTPFQKKHYYSPLMKGSYSIKAVMPALVPEMENAYHELDVVHNGGEAMSIYSTLHLVKDKAEVDRIRQGLLEYCKLDTLSMVKILEKLRELV